MAKSTTQSQWTVFHLSCEWGRRERRKMKQKQEIWRLLLLCALLANQVCVRVCVCVFNVCVPFGMQELDSQERCFV